MKDYGARDRKVGQRTKMRSGKEAPRIKGKKNRGNSERARYVRDFEKSHENDGVIE